MNGYSLGSNKMLKKTSRKAVQVRHQFDAWVAEILQAYLQAVRSVLMEFKVGNVKIHTSIAGIVKIPERSGKNLKKIFGGLNKMNCLREAFEELKLFVWTSNFI